MLYISVLPALSKAACTPSCGVLSMVQGTVPISVTASCREESKSLQQNIL